jgi:hypothetical protein
MRSAKGRIGALAAVCGAVAATQIAITGMASASPSPSAIPPSAGITVKNTLISAGSSGAVDISTPNNDPLQISFDPRGANFGMTPSAVTWDGSTCQVIGGEFLNCTPTNGSIRVYLHVPSTATVGGTVVVQAGAWDTGGKGVVTVYYPGS